MGVIRLQLFVSFGTYNSHKLSRGNINLSVFKTSYHEGNGIKFKSTTPESIKNSEEKFEDEFNSKFSDKLVKWCVENNISCISFSKLLVLLSEYGIKDLPKNSRVLLKAREDEIKATLVPPGVYTHFSLKKNLRFLVSNLIAKNHFKKTDIGLSIFIDNLPLSKFTKQSLWVILGSVVGFNSNIFCIGVYEGFSRPKNPNLFLSEFVTEAKLLCKEGLEINDTNYNVKIERLICDAPAKAFVLNIKDHKGYSSCTKCNTVGEYSSKKMCFSEKGTLRKDEDFQQDEVYRNSKTNLLEIPGFGVVSNVTLDYMHLVCLGVLNKIMKIWLTDDEHWISEEAATKIMKGLIKTNPVEFKYTVKSLKLLSRWNAELFRQFLLYYGPIILKDNLNEKNYDHFLLLHVACRLLCTEASSENINYGRELLNTFVENFKKLYKKPITHNFHGLYHLADECSSHGTLDNFSSFPFERFLIRLRNSMRKSRKKTIPNTILRVSYNKILTRSLKNLTDVEYKTAKALKSESHLTSFSEYEKLALRNFEIIPNTEGDKYVLLKNQKIIEVKGVFGKKEKSNKTILITGNEFSSICNFHSKPFDSIQLNMFKVGEVSKEEKQWEVDMIDRKCMKVPIGNEESVMIGLLDENY